MRRTSLGTRVGSNGCNSTASTNRPNPAAPSTYMLTPFTSSVMLDVNGVNIDGDLLIGGVSTHLRQDATSDEKE